MAGDECGHGDVYDGEQKAGTDSRLRRTVSSSAFYRATL